MSLLIPTQSMNAYDVAEWWSNLDSEKQAEFLGMLCSALIRSCKDKPAFCWQTDSIQRELQRDKYIGLATWLKDLSSGAA